MQEQDGSGYGVCKFQNKDKNQTIIKQHKLTRMLFQNNGWRKAYINKSIKLDFAIETKNFCDSDILTEKLQYEYKRLNSPELSEDILYTLGLKKFKAKLYFKIIKDLIGTSYTNDQLLEIIAEYATGKFDTKIDPRKGFLYNEEIVDVWYEFQGIQCLNIKTDIYLTVEQSIAKFVNNKNKYVFFHATSWENYLDAIQLCEKSYHLWKNMFCIMIFTTSALKDVEGMSFRRFEKDSIEWQKLVKDSRHCKENDLDDYDVIYGPMCANPSEVKTLNMIPKTHTRMKFQLVSKSEKSDRFFTSHHCATLFFRL